MPGPIFDPTINLGSVCTIATMVIGMVGIMWRHSIDMAILKASHHDVKADVSEIKEKIGEIAVVQHQLADGKERMDKLETDYKERIEVLKKENLEQAKELKEENAKRMDKLEKQLWSLNPAIPNKQVSV